MRLRRRSVDIIVRDQDEDHTDAPGFDAPHTDAPDAPGDPAPVDRVDTLVLTDRPVPIYWFAPGVVPPTRRNGHTSPEDALAPTAATPVSLVVSQRATTPPDAGRDVSPAVPAVPAEPVTPAVPAVPAEHVTPAVPPAADPAVEPEQPRAGAPRRIGELLLDRGIITQEQLDLAVAEHVASGLRMGTQLVRLGAVTERQLIEVLAEQLGLPVTDLRLALPSPEAVAKFPEDLARLFEVVPVRMVAGGMEVAVADVLDPQTRAAIEAGTGCQIVPVLAPPSEIERAIDQAYLALAGVEQQVTAFEAMASSRTRVDAPTQIVVDDHAPVVQVVTMLLTQAVRDRASDIHVEPQDGRVRVRFRVDGVLRDITTVPDSMAQALISRIKVMADMNIVERRRPQDGQIATEIDGRPLDIRVATTSTIWGEKAVLRLLDKTRGLRTLGELGMTPGVGGEFSRLIASPFGMVICAGPTGSGKTTTLYAALTEIDSPERNITTIEDPVEYVLPSINQIQVNRQAGITFADGLKSILRQDPDVILVGEIRDAETARIAVQSALTGHFVLSSLHATDAATALQRFRDMGIEPFLITSSLLAVVSQRLVRRICQHCKQPYEPTSAERTFFKESTGRTKDRFWAGEGCNLCLHTGYQDRIGIYELLPVTEPIKQLVIADAGYNELRNLAISEGMQTLRDEALRLIDEDVTTIAEAVRTVYVQ